MPQMIKISSAAAFAAALLLPLPMAADSYRTLSEDNFHDGIRWNYDVARSGFDNDGQWDDEFPLINTVHALESVEGHPVVRLLEHPEGFYREERDFLFDGTDWRIIRFEDEIFEDGGKPAETQDYTTRGTSPPGFRYLPEWVSGPGVRQQLDQGQTTFTMPEGSFDIHTETFLTFEGTETIDVPAGRFRTVRVLLEESLDGGDLGTQESWTRLWIDPYMGIVQKERFVESSEGGEVTYHEEDVYHLASSSIDYPATDHRAIDTVLGRDGRGFDRNGDTTLDAADFIHP